MAFVKNFKGSRGRVDATEAKAEGKAFRKTADASAIAEGLAELEPSAAEIALEAELEEEDFWATQDALEDFPCGDCGLHCFWIEVKGEPCSMFVELVAQDGTIRGPWDWNFDISDEEHAAAQAAAAVRLGAMG